MNLVWKLLRQHISIPQFAGFAFANLFGMLIVLFGFILADEPISHLDDNNSRIMADIMMTEAKEQGAGVIVTSIGKHMDLPYEHTFKL